MNDNKYELIGELFELRKKEVLEGLSYEEQDQVSAVANEIDKAFSKRKPLHTKENQMTCEMNIVSIRRPRVVEKKAKQSFFEKLRKKEPVIQYELVLDHEDDLKFSYYTYAFLLSVRTFMRGIGLEQEWLTVATPIFDYDGGFEFAFSEKEKEWLEQLPAPAESLRMLNQVKDIEERARMHSDEMLDFIQFIKGDLEEDYVSYIDYTELQYLEIS